MFTARWLSVGVLVEGSGSGFAGIGEQLEQFRGVALAIVDPPLRPIDPPDELEYFGVELVFGLLAALDEL